ncbi:MAG: peptide-methionine (S)-S-oxide reductase MsrA, partial [Asgard group archaeon]|nr:peptide-methionine (S)-S-oxide reductase MsrA [Asgard group archaeon]
EEIYNQLNGVENAISGYAGGFISYPDYKLICNSETGHAEVVKVEFDSSIISLKQILEIFFVMHDPTTIDRQGNDIGPQYRSIILYNSERQKDIINETLNDITDKKIWSNKIVTQIIEYDDNTAAKFWIAEEYHQKYFQKNPTQGYCQVVINPKINKFRKEFFQLLKN